MSNVDRPILGYMACHPLVLVSHVRSLLGFQEREVTEKLDALVTAGLVRNGPRLRHQRAGYQITADGLREIGSELPLPRLDLRRYWQDIGVAWLSLSAQGGGFGEVDRVYCGRECVPRTTCSRPVDSRLTRAGHRSVRTPLRLRSGHGLTAPLQTRRLRSTTRMSFWSSRRDGWLLSFSSALSAPGARSDPPAHGRKSSIAVVLYLVQDGAIGDAVQAAAARLGLARLVHVQRVRPCSTLSAPSGQQRIQSRQGAGER